MHVYYVCTCSIFSLVLFSISNGTTVDVKVIESRNLKKKDLFSENDAYVQIDLDDKIGSTKINLHELYEKRTVIFFLSKSNPFVIRIVSE